MKFLRNFKLLIISTLWVCMAQNGTPKKSITRTKVQDTTIIVDSTVTSLSVNEHVLVSTKFSEKNFNRKYLKAWFRQNPAKVYQRNDGILIGYFRKHPQAWYYAQIISTSDVNQQLVVEELR